MPSVVIFFGLIASGKSTLARAFAASHGCRYYNTDVVRKELAGMIPATPQHSNFDSGIYTPENTRRTYQAMADLADTDLSRGLTVVLDGSYQSKEERARVLALAAAHGVTCRFVLCLCPEAEALARMARRETDPNNVSDGRQEIFRRQLDRFEEPAELPPGALIRLQTDKTVAELVTMVENALVAPNP